MPQGEFKISNNTSNNCSKSYIKIIAKDPNTVYSYWEITTDTQLKFQTVFGKPIWENSRLILRVHDISKNKFSYVNVAPNDSFCYFCVNQPCDIFNVEIGKLVGEEFFIPFATSNIIELANNKIITNGVTQFVDVKVSKHLMKTVNADEIYNHFGFNDVFKVLGPSSSEHVKYVEEHDF